HKFCFYTRRLLHMLASGLGTNTRRSNAPSTSDDRDKADLMRTLVLLEKRRRREPRSISCRLDKREAVFCGRCLATAELQTSPSHTLPAYSTNASNSEHKDKPPGNLFFVRSRQRKRSG